MLCCRCKREIPDGSFFCNYCGKRQTAAGSSPARPTARRPRGTGSVVKLAGKRTKPYNARLKGISIGTFSTRGQALLALDAFIARSRPLDAYSATFEQVFEEWKTIHYPDIGEKTAKGYTDAFVRSKPLYKKRMQELRTSDYQRIIDKLVADGKSYSLCQKQNGLFMQLNSYAVERDIIEKNYAEFVRLPKKPAPKQRVLSEEEQAAIWKVAQKEGALQEIAKITVVLFMTGMRINELLMLRSEDVHLEEGYAVGGEKTQAGKNRVIPLHPSIRPFIEEWLERGDKTLISTSVGTKRDDSHVRHSFKDLMESLDIEGVTPHTCRHTCATMMAAAGVAPKAIQTILGHASYSTTAAIYTHPQVAELLQATEKTWG